MAKTMTHDENRKKKTPSTIGMANIPQSPERVQSSQYATFHGFHNMCAGHVRMCVCQCAQVCVSMGRDGQEAVTVHPDNSLVL